ncbi:MAG: manganese efflux pump MntP family protein [bacterium]|nr:manganese efflux pump MntP family protein [bacterium]
MDVFAVSIAIALSLGEPSRRRTLRIALHFGLFQFFMPIAGWLAGRGLAASIERIDHWLAFALLLIVGGRMLYDSAVIGRADGAARCDPTRGGTLILLSLATSIDAFAVGLSLSFISAAIVSPAIVIGAVAFALSVAGMELAPRAGRVVGKEAEIAGGVILILIGIWILVSHLAG